MDTDIQRYARAMPQFRESLDFLQRILDFQTTLADKVESTVRIEAAVARDRLGAGQPLFASGTLPIPVSLFQEALADLRPLLPPEGPAQAMLDRLVASSLMTSSNVETLLGDLVNECDTCIRQLTDTTGTDSDISAFLLHTALSPFLEKQVTPHREWVEMVDWRQGICPMCGSEPWMARLAHQDGRRTLVCSLCHTEWRFDRLRCPFCEDDGQPLVHHFTVDDDEAHRVDCCNRCHRYIKTVDERVWGRPANLMVEDVITAHLDTLAREQGYR
jgi:FdhE protein